MHTTREDLRRHEALVARHSAGSTFGRIGPFGELVARSMGSACFGLTRHRLGRLGLVANRIAQDTHSPVDDHRNATQHRGALSHRQASDVHGAALAGGRVAG